MATKTKSKRIFYFDALRTLAICSVIIFHIFLMMRKGIAPQHSGPTLTWISCAMTGVWFRCGVDIFLMLSGALSLGRVWDIKPFLGKRIPRITLPFVFWGFVLSIALIVLNYYFPANYSVIQDFTLQNILNVIAGAYLAETFSFTPYWFFWMILGTYLFMPVLNKWLLNADLKEAEYFLVLWLVTCLFTYTLKMDFPINLTYFTGPVGMVVLGYYLRHTKRKIFNNIYVATILLLVSLSLLLMVCYIRSTPNIIISFHRYSLFTVFEAISLFIFFKNFKSFNAKSGILTKFKAGFKKAVFAIAKYSYGIYLVHNFILKGILRTFIQDIPFKFSFFIYFFGTLIICMILLSLLNRVPYLNQCIGAK